MVGVKNSADIMGHTVSGTIGYDITHVFDQFDFDAPLTCILEYTLVKYDSNMDVSSTDVPAYMTFDENTYTLSIDGGQTTNDADYKSGSDIELYALRVSVQGTNVEALLPFKLMFFFNCRDIALNYQDKGLRNNWVPLQREFGFNRPTFQS